MCWTEIHVKQLTLETFEFPMLSGWWERRILAKALSGSNFALDFMHLESLTWIRYNDVCINQLCIKCNSKRIPFMGVFQSTKLLPTSIASRQFNAKSVRCT